jgi:hypothetical protein
MNRVGYIRVRTDEQAGNGVSLDAHKQCQSSMLIKLIRSGFHMHFHREILVGVACYFLSFPGIYFVF